MIRTGQNSFVSGEITPALFGRSDIKARFQGAKRIENYIVRKSGGLIKRGGSDIVLDLSAYSGGRVIPFYYDIKSSYLLVLCGGLGRVVADGDFVQSGGSDYTFVIPWKNDQLSDIRFEQYGDTLHLTHLDVQAQRIARYADDDWRVTPVAGAVSVVPPQGFAAVASGFGTSASDITQKYALYAVRDGVLSEPVKKSATVETPWTAGGQVRLSWHPNMLIHDSYIVAKDMGAYFCILAQYYEEKSVIDGGGLTFAADSVHSDADYLFSSSVPSDLASDSPNDKEFVEVQLFIHKYEFHCAKSGSTCVFDFDYSYNDKLETLQVYLGAKCASVDAQHTVFVDYEETPVPYVLQGQRDSDDVWESVGSGTLSCAYGGSDSIAGDGVTKYNHLKLTLTVDSADSGIVFRGFKVFSPGAVLEQGSWTFNDATKAFAARGVSGTVEPNSGLGTNPYSDDSDADISASESGSAGLFMSCEPEKNVYIDKYPCALGTAAEGDEKVAIVRITDNSVISAVELRVYHGAEVKNSPDNVNDETTVFKSNIASAQLMYSFNGTEWSTLSTVFSTQSQYSQSPWVLEIPQNDNGQPVVTSAQGWAVRFVADDPDEPVVIHGLQLVEMSVEDSFTDVNHTPNEAVGKQIFIDPGSDTTDMAVACVSTYQQRMIYAGSSDYPFTVWFSAVGNPDLLYSSSPIIATDGFSATIPSARAARIRHVLSARRCLVFTEGGVYSIEGSSTEGFSYDTIQIKEVSGLGANEAEPVGLTNSVLFVGSSGRELLELQYDITQDGMLPLERIVLADHLTEGAEITKMAYQRAPEGVVWCLLSDGTVLTFTCLPEHKVYAWARVSFGGGAVVDDIISTGAVPDPDDDVKAEGEIYAVVTQGHLTRLVQLRPAVASSAPVIEHALTIDLMQSVTLAASGMVLEPVHVYPADDGIVAVHLTSGAVSTLTAQADGTLLSASELAAGDYAVGYKVAAQVDVMPPEVAEQSLQGLRKNCINARILTRRSASPGVAPFGTEQPFTGEAAPDVAEGTFVLPDSKGFDVTPYGNVNDEGWMSIKSDSVFPGEILSLIFTLSLER